MAHTMKTVGHTLNGVDPALNPALAEAENKTGPDILLRIMANRPQAMERFFGLYETILLSPGAITPRLREMLYLAASFVNECDRCTKVHTLKAREAGVSEREIDEIRTEQNQNFDDRERTALMYARDLTRNMEVDGDLRYGMQELFSIEEWVEITLVVAMANFTNRFNEGLGIGPD